MEASQLRIGNYVYRQSSKLIVDKSSVYQIENVNLQSALKYEPIPLTEEWLIVKFKSVKRKNIHIFNHASMQLEVFEGKMFHSILAIEIKTVHQLQNLFYALTGEELTVNN